MRLLLLVLLLLAGCLADAEQARGMERATPSSTATRVEVATLSLTDARLDLSLPGEIEGSRDALLASALGGFVERVAVKDGAVVRRGQLLVRIDGELHAAQRDQAAAQLAQSEAELGRLEALGDHATPSQLEQARTQVAVTGAALRQAQAQHDRSVIRAPFDGTVAGLDVEEGEYAAPGSPVLRLVQLDPVRVTLSVPDRDVVALEEGMEVTVTASSRARTFPGTVDHVGRAGDLRTRTFPVRVHVPNPDGALLPGMIARVGATRTLSDEAIVLPQDWVVTRLEGQGVFLEEEGVARWRPVTLGPLLRHQVVVEEGLAPGDRVVMTGHRELVDGEELLVSREAWCCRDGRAVFGARE